MQGISIFQQIYAPRVAHVVTGFDGISHNTHSPYAIGGVVGSVGKMTAIVANDQADTWHIVNLKRGNLFDAVAVLGAFDESEAANMAMRYHGQYFDAVCGDVCESNTGGLQRFLNHPVYMRTNRPVYAEELAKLQDVPSTQAILWDGVQLKSHNGSSKHLLLDMMRCDDDKALLEKMDFVEEESQLDGEIAEYDALVVEAYKLESTVSKLALAMDKATSIGTLKVAKQTLSKPKTMRGFGVIQQLVSFELSDGQAVSIIFNVSDSEANASAKMTKDDLLVAWKYKLNSRDITAAVQPNATQNVSLNMIASRIMGLADANSEKFVAAQKKKDAMQTELANTNQRVKDLQSQEQALLQEIADLQKQLDEKAKNKALQEAESRAEVEGMAKAVQSAHAELDARVDALDARGLGYLGAFLNYNTTDISKIAEKTKLEHPDDLKAALDKLDNAMAQDEVRKKLAQIEKQPTREDALALAVKLTKEMPDEADKIRISLNLAIATNKWKGIKITLPQQPAKLKTDADVLASMKKIQKSLVNTGFNLNLSKANTDFIRGTLIKGSGSSMSSQEFSYFNNKGFDLGYIEYGNQFDFDTFNPILKGIEKWLQGEIVPSFFVGIDDDWDMDIMATPLKIKEALDKALSEGLAMQQPSEPETTLQQDVSKSELFKDKNVWAIDDFGKENGMVIYSRDEQDGFSIGIVDKLKQVNMQYTDIDTDQQTNESFSTENITNEQVIEKIKMFIAKHEQKSVELLPVQPISEPPVVEQDNAEKNMTAADFLALGGKEWVKDDMTRIYINAKVFNDLMGTSFGDSNNKFFFDVNTSALMRSYKGKKPQVEKQYEPVQQPTEAEPTPAPNKKMYTPKDILDSDLSIDEKISEAEKLLESDKLNAAKQKIKIDESNKFYLSHVRQAEGGYLFTDLPRNASLTSVVHARIGIDVGFIEYLKNRKENPPKPADTQAQTPPDIGDTVIGDMKLSDLFKVDMAKKSNGSPELRIARQSILDAEDAAKIVIDTGDIDAFKKFADIFPSTHKALLDMSKLNTPKNPDRDLLDFALVTFSSWKKGGKHRIYLKVSENDNAFNDMDYGANDLGYLEVVGKNGSKKINNFSTVSRYSELEDKIIGSAFVDALQEYLSLKDIDIAEFNVATLKVKIKSDADVLAAKQAEWEEEANAEAQAKQAKQDKTDLQQAIIKENIDKFGRDVVVNDLSDAVLGNKAKVEAILAGALMKDEDFDSFLSYQASAKRVTSPNPDRDYLQSIIDGDVDLSNADEIEAKLTDINERLDADLEPLFEQAAEVFAQYGIAQAATN